MKITKHISFFWIEERRRYVNQIIEETNGYNYQTDIFIHTNNLSASPDLFIPYSNGTFTIVPHDLTGENPFYLTWKSRVLMKNQRDDYDIFIYVEDDILIPKKTIEYWETYHENLVKNGFNLGFVRIETKDDEEYMTDIVGSGLSESINFDSLSYAINGNNPYCAFWIYDKKEFNRFVDSIYWDLNNIPDLYGIREKSAVGLHGLWNKWYKKTLIPIIDNKLIYDCRVYHLPNNYIDSDTGFGKLKFNEALKTMTFL